MTGFPDHAAAAGERSKQRPNEAVQADQVARAKFRETRRSVDTIRVAIGDWQRGQRRLGDSIRDLRGRESEAGW